MMMTECPDAYTWMDDDGVYLLFVCVVWFCYCSIVCCGREVRCLLATRFVDRDILPLWQIRFRMAEWQDLIVEDNRYD